MSVRDIKVSKQDLAAIRERIGIGQTAFGRRLYGDPAVYRKYETGMRDAPPMLVLLMAQWARHGMPDDLEGDVMDVVTLGSGKN